MGLTAPSARQLAGWTPIGITWAENEPAVDWCFTEGDLFDDPFFSQAVERCLRHPFRLLFRHQTTMAALEEVAASGDAVPLAGLVFHSSRCGSTLVSQMLAHLPTTLVLAEPGPLESLLAAQRPDWLRWMVAALGQRRRREQERLVVKLDAWAILYLPLILAAFPETPWTFLYRDPQEVLVSHLGHRGYHMVPGCLPPGLLGLEPEEPSTLAPEEYMARVLGALLDAAAHGADVAADAAGAADAADAADAVAGAGPPLLVNYRELPGAVVDRIAPWFGANVAPGDLASLSEVAARDAKNRYVTFDAASDQPAKKRRVNESLLAADERWARPGYQRLEARRLGSP